MHNEIIHAFLSSRKVLSVKPFGNGHINDTYKVDFVDDGSSYILQRINTHVFKNPQALINNHLRLQTLGSAHTGGYILPELVQAGDGKYFYVDNLQQFWRMTTFIESAYSIEVLTENWQALEAGKAFGWFADFCKDLNTNAFIEAIPHFHRLSFRLCQLDEAIKEDKARRLVSVKATVKFYHGWRDRLTVIDRLLDTGKLPLHVVHNDTKINNLLFRDNAAVAVIDLDTAGPGLLYYDFGDAIRTIANTAAEDEPDLSRVHFNFQAFSAFSLGYLSRIRTMILPLEKTYFYLAPFLMTYIMGIRFLADYLNGDVYYKTSYPEHNLVRCLVQQTLLQRMETGMHDMQDIINEVLNN